MSLGADIRISREGKTLLESVLTIDEEWLDSYNSEFNRWSNGFRGITERWVRILIEFGIKKELRREIYDDLIKFSQRSQYLLEFAKSVTIID
jgi:hypothetical protein